MKRVWTNSTVERLKQLCDAGMSDSEIADALGTSEKSVYSQRWRMGLKGNKLKTKAWDAAETERLIKLAQDHTCAEIAKILGRPYTSVLGKAKLLGIKIKAQCHYADSANDSEHTNIGVGPYREYTRTTDMLIMQYLSEEYSLAHIAAILHRDYKDLQRYFSENQDKLQKAHAKMMRYGGVYAVRLQRRKEA